MAYHPENADKIRFSNRHGEVSLRRHGGARSVHGLRWDHIPECCRVDDKTAAQIALISENDHLQPMFEVPMRNGGEWAFVAHVSAGRVFLTELDSIRCGVEDPHDEIERINRGRTQMATHAPIF